MQISPPEKEGCMIYWKKEDFPMKTIDLNGQWRLSPRDKNLVAPFCTYFLKHQSIPCTLPGDIHTALIEQELIPDPYWGTNELDIQWVGQQDWVLSKDITCTQDVLNTGSPILTLTMADTVISILINGQEAESATTSSDVFALTFPPFYMLEAISLNWCSPVLRNRPSRRLNSFPIRFPIQSILFQQNIGISYGKPNVIAAGTGVLAS